MINTNKLRGRIVEKGKTIQSLAPIVGVSAYILGRKISNENPMQIEEADTLIKELEIEKEEIPVYFFYKENCNNATK